MMNYFIVGLPRSRTAWLANFLTHGASLCFHEALRYVEKPEELKAFMERDADYVGDCDPMLAIHWRKVAEMFPDAKWVVIDRKIEDVRKSCQRVGVPEVGLEKLHENLSELCKELTPWYVDYERLDDNIHGLWAYLFPSVPFPEDRYAMLRQMYVDTVPQKVEMHPKLRTLITPESSVMTPLHYEYAETLKAMCGQDVHAYTWLLQLMEVCLTWDHIVDGDPLDVQMAERSFEAMLLEWPLNPFWNRAKEFLAPVMSNAIAAWRFGQRTKEYDVYTEVPCAVAFILGGTPLVKQFSTKIREISKQMIEEDNTKDSQCQQLQQQS